MLARVWRVLGPVVRWVDAPCGAARRARLPRPARLPAGRLPLHQVVRAGMGGFWTAITTPPAVTALWLSAQDRSWWWSPSTRRRRRRARCCSRATGSSDDAPLDLIFDVPVAVSPIIIGTALILAYAAHRLVRAVAAAQRDHGDLQPDGHRARDDGGLAALRAALGRARARRARRRPRSRRRARSGRARRGGSSRSRCPPSAGASLYGIVLTLARALGEFGAVVIVSGHLADPDAADLHLRRDGPEQRRRRRRSPRRVVLASISIAALIVLCPSCGRGSGGCHVDLA